jgi:hypothetical protein
MLAYDFTDGNTSLLLEAPALQVIQHRHRNAHNYAIVVR